MKAAGVNKEGMTGFLSGYWKWTLADLRLELLSLNVIGLL